MAEFPGSISGGAKLARILVVDDNEDVRQMMAVALHTNGYAVEEASEVITKPVNLDRLMSQVRLVLESAGKVAPSPPAPRDGAVPTADLVLYVSAGSAASARARRSMDETLRGYAGSPIRYSVRDVAEEPGGAEEDQVVFTPTLVKRGPGPRAWVLGDLADAAVVIELLKICGLKPST